MDIVELLKTIKEDWAILMFFFALGGAWWQGKAWFDRVNRTLDNIKETSSTSQQNITELHQRIEHLHDRVGNLEKTTTNIHEELHQQEIKLAVIQGSAGIERRRNRAAP